MPGLAGTFTVTVTPFTADGGEIDEAVLRRLVDWQIDSGIHGLIPVASTGEFLSLSDDERRRVAEIVITQADKRVPVLVGAGAESTWDVVRYSREAESLGADGVLVIPPFYSTPTEEELFVHYRTIAETISIPVMLYNNPATANVDMKPPLVARLSEIDNVSYIKESTMDANRVSEILDLCGGRMSVFGGILGYESFENGAVGWTAVGANLMPREFSDLYRLCIEAGDRPAAQALNERISPVVELVGQDRYVSATKKALELMGLPVGPPRPPRLPVQGDTLARVQRVVTDLNLSLGTG